MTALIDIVPDKDVLLALEPEELGVAILRTLLSAFGATPYGGQVQLNGFLNANLNAYRPPTFEVADAIHEAWAWLEGQGLILLDRRQVGHTDYRILSRRAQRLAKSNATHLRPSTALTRASLHPSIRDDVWDLFVRGKYDTAVFEAFKAVEINVRSAAELPNKELGVALMRKAFDKNTGPLRDVFAEEGEREARAHLFAGAIGSYKNPTSHREINLEDPAEVAEVVLLANHLLRLIDRAVSDREMAVLIDGFQVNT